jgi:hypothetical protein
MKVGVLAIMIAILLPFGAMAGPAPDSDSDGTVDAVDGCSQDNRYPHPVTCDTDNDGYGNCCDGDFDNDGDVDAQDFSSLFFPCFTATVDSGVGCDMDCDGDVDAQDFSSKFFPQFLQTAPGPSGLSCAGTVPCP